MFEYRMDKLFYIVGNDEAAALDHRESLGCAEQRGRASRTNAELNFRMFARAIHDLNHVIEDRLVDVNFAVLRLKKENFGRRQNGVGSALAIAVRKPLEDFFLSGWIRVADFDSHQESLELRFRKRIN